MTIKWYYPPKPLKPESTKTCHFDNWPPRLIVVIVCEYKPIKMCNEVVTNWWNANIHYDSMGGGGGVGGGVTRSGLIRGCAAPGSEPLPYFKESRTPKTYPILGKSHNPGHPKQGWGQFLFINSIPIPILLRSIPIPIALGWKIAIPIPFYQFQFQFLFINSFLKPN